MGLEVHLKPSLYPLAIIVKEGPSLLIHGEKPKDLIFSITFIKGLSLLDFIFALSILCFLAMDFSLKTLVYGRP